MEGLRFIKIIFSFSILLLSVFLISCQSPLFQIPYNAKNDLTEKSDYYGPYTSKNSVGQNANEKLNVFITNDVTSKVYDGEEVIITNSIYIWIGSGTFPSTESEKFTIGNSNIDGEFPHYAFNNEEIVGKLTIVNNKVITITFATLYPPYLNIQNVTCNKTQ